MTSRVDVAMDDRAGPDEYAGPAVNATEIRTRAHFGRPAPRIGNSRPHGVRREGLNLDAIGQAQRVHCGERYRFRQQSERQLELELLIGEQGCLALAQSRPLLARFNAPTSRKEKDEGSKEQRA
jgi:hypothetical protein